MKSDCEKAEPVQPGRSSCSACLLILLSVIAVLCFIFAFQFSCKSSVVRIEITASDQRSRPADTRLSSSSRLPTPFHRRHEMDPKKASIVKFLHKLTRQIDPEIHMNTCEMVHRWGYPCENHTVTTKDGYILSLQRIPYGKRSTGDNHNRYPVFLQHGLMSSSADWVDNLPNVSLGYILADRGYDVWMGNFRGNVYSRRHVRLDPDQRPFWRFSWDEMARYDLPAMLHYVLDHTRSRDLFYVGHSQGTMAAFAEFSRNHALGKRIRMFFALAPITTIGHMKTRIINAFAPFSSEIVAAFYDVGFKGEFLPNGDDYVDWLNLRICNDPLRQFVCEDFMYILFGISCNNKNETRLPVFLSKTPAGTSFENMQHLGQLIVSKKFRMFDFGSAENWQRYNQSSPPAYDVSGLRTPVALYWGGADWLADTEDVLGLLERLRHIEHTKFVPTFDHLDFMWGTTAREYVYDDMVEIMNRYLQQ